LNQDPRRCWKSASTARQAGFGQAAQQPLAQGDDDARAAGRHVEPAQQLLARRLDRLGEPAQMQRALFLAVGRGRGQHLLAVGAETLRQHLEELGLFLRGEPLEPRGELARIGERRRLAAARQHARAERLEIGAGRDGAALLRQEPPAGIDDLVENAADQRCRHDDRFSAPAPLSRPAGRAGSHARITGRDPFSTPECGAK
jgi:hypothetical protein